eukprot:TRINITY_DN635_c3_g1_i3.p1 TRINITY_DN635_c3_g1~~TRINITY_DN635_c3_g1_i3.p1  ORF type:complete len:123 (+),score=19.25 TRINITY_DN635_c3_g1_i3:146-514(+)
MSTVIIYAHPKETSFNHAILKSVTDHLDKKHEKYVVRDLYAMKFNPVDYADQSNEDVAVEQKIIKEAKRIVIIAPMYWYSFPAILKGYIDRVFTYGFAYEFSAAGPKGLLSHIDIKMVLFVI